MVHYLDMYASLTDKYEPCLIINFNSLRYEDSADILG